MLVTILVVALVFALLGTLPIHYHSSDWGYRPSGVIGAILVVLLIYLFLSHSSAPRL